MRCHSQASADSVIIGSVASSARSSEGNNAKTAAVTSNTMATTKMGERGTPRPVGPGHRPCAGHIMLCRAAHSQGAAGHPERGAGHGVSASRAAAQVGLIAAYFGESTDAR